MLLIIAHHHDAEARWLYQILQKESKLNATLLVPEALGIDYSISLHLSNGGEHHSSIFFHEVGVRLDCKTISYVINRLSFIDPIVWKNADVKEKIYTTNEMNAFFPAFIHSLVCPVSNAIHNGALYGEPTFISKWATYFLEQKMHVHPILFEPIIHFFKLLQNTDGEKIFRFLKVGTQLISPPQQRLAQGFPKLKKTILQKEKQEMLEYIFVEINNNLQLVHVSKTPVLSLYGRRFTNAIYQQIKIINHDIIDGHTQRNTFALAG